MKNPIRLVSVTAVVVLAVAGLVGCAPGTYHQCNGTTPTTVAVNCTSTTTAPAPRRVLVIGDSITAQSAARINSALTAAGFVATVSGHAGYSALDTSITNRPTLGTIVDTYATNGLDPDIVILEAGTNDVSAVRAGGATAADFAARMATFRDRFPRACVAVTTVTTHRNDPTFNTASSALNAALVSTFGRVIPWDATEWALRQSGTLVLQSDLIHPTNPDGQIVVAGLDRDAAAACP